VVHLFDVRVASDGQLSRVADVTGRYHRDLNTMDLPSTTSITKVSSSLTDYTIEFPSKLQPVPYYHVCSIDIG
jgi:hypothetical protein